jgi:hypothetical protein
MSAKEDNSAEKSDGLECFNFQLLLDDISGSNKKRKYSSREAVQNEYSGKKEEKQMGRGYPDISGSAGQNDGIYGQGPRHKHSADNIMVGLHSPSDKKGGEKNTMPGTRSECNEMTRDFNIWGRYDIDKASGFKTLFGAKFQKQESKFKMRSAVKPSRESDPFDEADLQPPLIKKNSLKMSAGDEFYPRDATNYRKLSYQDHYLPQGSKETSEDILDIKKKLNLDHFALSPNISPVKEGGLPKLASYVSPDLGTLVRQIESSVSSLISKIESEEEFPQITVTFGKR